MDGNNWIIVVSMAILMVFDTGGHSKKCHSLKDSNASFQPNPDYEDLMNCISKEKNITIVDGEISGVIFNCSECTGEGNEKLICPIFVFDTHNDSGTAFFKHGCRNLTYKDLKFWLKKELSTNTTYLKVKGEVTDRLFNVMFCSQEGNCTWQFKHSKICEDSEYDENCADGPFEIRINITNSGLRCSKCGNPIKDLPKLDTTEIPGFPDIPAQNNSGNGESVDPGDASKVMQQLSSVAKFMGNLTEASLSIGPIKGVIVKPKDEADLYKLSFVSTDSALNLIQDEAKLKEYPLSVSVSEEAYRKSYNQLEKDAFVGVFRFPNMTEGFNLSCQSWDGEGAQPNWTDTGCLTNISNNDVTCECSHLTFFAVLMTPPEKNISASDLTSLTYITYIGCGISLFFLGIALFMFCCIRRAKASNATHILIHLILALFLLDLTFLSNESIAGMGSNVACKVMGGVMHYSMLCSFTWFAVEAFHLCLQLTKFATVTIANYKLKLCCIGWLPGAVVVLILFGLETYGELKIYTDSGTVVKMCWITNFQTQYVVNIGYYAVVFLFTSTIFVVMLRWLCYLRGSKLKQGGSTRSQDVIAVMGLCCMLGLTWSFAFFSYGPLRVPSYYIFSVLNSLQGFFLFLYYYNTSSIIGEGETNSSSSSSTKTSISDASISESKNPYM
ncbi:adhesion G-protein coupled receptor G5 isoform X2 [Alosa pseudoharengus]|uniref:adhesion G-protein coupled receptor G5 isoform X2 n=1 Tax=Alosa pseudoharengus TaxID=34774 RepID=UPI003F89E7B3